MNHIQVRYNTKSVDEKLPWRVNIDGQEFLAQDVTIVGNAYSEKTYVDGVAKYNLAIDGSVTWDGDAAMITSLGAR